MSSPYPPAGWYPRREPGESDDAAIARFEDEITWPHDDDAPRDWEPR